MDGLQQRHRRIRAKHGLINIQCLQVLLLPFRSLTGVINSHRSPSYFLLSENSLISTTLVISSANMKHEMCCVYFTLNALSACEKQVDSNFPFMTSLINHTENSTFLFEYCATFWVPHQCSRGMCRLPASPLHSQNTPHTTSR